MTKKTVIFTGGGSGGHVIPALTLIDQLREDKIHIHYIGGRTGIERELSQKKGLSYTPIFTGKLRRYFSLENVIDIFKVALGFIQSFFALLSFNRKTTLIFSTGGFVSVPVVLAAKLLGFTIFIHEQTTRVGLANKICGKFADKIFVSFEDSLQFFPQGKTSHSGYPLRATCYTSSIGDVVLDGNRINDLEKPILFVTGGGNGSVLINELISTNMDQLKDIFVIIHQVGKDFVESFETQKSDSYIPLSFIHGEMIDLYKLSDVVISRAGAGTVCELMALRKSSLLIPLKLAQKNEQFHNAMEAANKLGSIVVEEENLKNLNLIDALEDLKKNRKEVLEDVIPNGSQNLLSEITNFLS